MCCLVCVVLVCCCVLSVARCVLHAVRRAFVLSVVRWYSLCRSCCDLLCFAMRCCSSVDVVVCRSPCVVVVSCRLLACGYCLLLVV